MKRTAEMTPFKALHVMAEARRDQAARLPVPETVHLRRQECGNWCGRLVVVRYADDWAEPDFWCVKCSLDWLHTWAPADFSPGTRAREKRWEPKSRHDAEAESRAREREMVARARRAKKRSGGEG